MSVLDNPAYLRNCATSSRSLTCFKSYDVRGQIGVNLDDDIVYAIGAAFAAATKPGCVVVGRDCRESSPALQAALVRGLCDQGIDVIDIGLAGTEEVYFATSFFGAGGGIEITASHNPIDYNGLKMVGPASRPLSKSQFTVVKTVAGINAFSKSQNMGGVIKKNPRADYAKHVAGFVNPRRLRPLKILVNAGNGTAGPAFDAIAATLANQGAPVKFVRMNHMADGSFPNGIPNPLLPENRPATAAAVREHGADLAVAWDGDFDRCFLFDENGEFVDGEHVVALLAAAFLAQEPGANIVHDPRIQWNTQKVVTTAGGCAVPSKTGHAYIKQTMRDANAVYGGEMSAHHYFRDFMFCDSGMIPWLKVIELMSSTGLPMSELIAQMRSDFPSSGELNFVVENADNVLERIQNIFAPSAVQIDFLDGLSMSFDSWRMNLRKSNTEPLLRLNIETLGDRLLLQKKITELKSIIDGCGNRKKA